MGNMVINKKYLNLSRFKHLKFWDYYTLSNKSQIYSNFELVSLSEVLTQRKENIIIDNAKNYKRCRVQTRGQGVILRDEVFGKEIKTKKQQVCKEDDFLVAEIDAKVGGYGIVPDYLEGAIVSGHYFLFEIDKTKLIPDFLSILVKCNDFSKQVKATGSTNYAAIRPYHVLEYLIPLPSISEQNRIVAAYNKKIRLAEEQEKKAEELGNSIEEFLFDELGIEKINELKRKKSFYSVSYQEIERWDVWVNIGEVKSRKYKNTIFRSVVIGKPQYGANEKGVKAKSDTRYIRITDINEAGYLNDEFVSPACVDERFLLKENDFLIARSGNTVGKTLLFKEKFGRAIYAGYLVKYNIDFSLIVPEYLFLFSKSYPFKKWIESNQRISGQPNINGQEFLQAPIILPPIEIQKEIALKIENKKFELRELRQGVINNRKLALKEFENEIFKPCN